MQSTNNTITNITELRKLLTYNSHCDVVDCLTLIRVSLSADVHASHCYIEHFRTDAVVAAAASSASAVLEQLLRSSVVATDLSVALL